MIAAIIQARMSSQRFPGKVLKLILERPMLALMIERVRSARKIDEIILATSTDLSDNSLEGLGQEEKVPVLRGSLEDVLDRYYQAAMKCKADTVVRLTGDCPLLDPRVIDQMIQVFHAGNYDYLANSVPPPGTWPDGMDIEIFSFKALEKAWNEARKPSEREHVTFYFWQNPDKFRTFRYDRKDDLSALRLTVDHPQDLEVVRKIYECLYPKNPRFNLEDILALLKKHPEIQAGNQDIKRNQGWASAFQKDLEAGKTQ